MLTLAYSLYISLSPEQILHTLMPQDLIVPTSFEMVGHIGLDLQLFWCFLFVVSNYSFFVQPTSTCVTISLSSSLSSDRSSLA